ncbi:MAG: hypothetical protein R3A11_07715 [Bdellovibrionota bacterium]
MKKMLFFLAVGLGCVSSVHAKDHALLISASCDTEAQRADTRFFAVGTHNWFYGLTHLGWKVSIICNQGEKLAQEVQDHWLGNFDSATIQDQLDRYKTLLDKDDNLWVWVYAHGNILMSREDNLSRHILSENFSIDLETDSFVDSDLIYDFVQRAQKIVGSAGRIFYTDSSCKGGFCKRKLSPAPSNNLCVNTISQEDENGVLANYTDHVSHYLAGEKKLDFPRMEEISGNFFQHQNRPLIEVNTNGTKPLSLQVGDLWSYGLSFNEYTNRAVTLGYGLPWQQEELQMSSYIGQIDKDILTLSFYKDLETWATHEGINLESVMLNVAHFFDKEKIKNDFFDMNSDDIEKNWIMKEVLDFFGDDKKLQKKLLKTSYFEQRKADFSRWYGTDEAAGERYKSDLYQLFAESFLSRSTTEELTIKIKQLRPQVEDFFSASMVLSPRDWESLDQTLTSLETWAQHASEGAEVSQLGDDWSRASASFSHMTACFLAIEGPSRVKVPDSIKIEDLEPEHVNTEELRKTSFYKIEWKKVQEKTETNLVEASYKDFAKKISIAMYALIEYVGYKEGGKPVEYFNIGQHSFIKTEYYKPSMDRWYQERLDWMVDLFGQDYVNDLLDRIQDLQLQMFSSNALFVQDRELFSINRDIMRSLLEQSTSECATFSLDRR